jgi:hypothetical protein
MSFPLVQPAALETITGLVLLVPVLRISRQYNGPVDGIRQPAMAAPDHHGADDHLADGFELPGEGRHDGRVAEGEADVGAVGLSVIVSLARAGRARGGGETYYAETTSNMTVKTEKD